MLSKFAVFVLKPLLSACRYVRSIPSRINPFNYGWETAASHQRATNFLATVLGEMQENNVIANIEAVRRLACLVSKFGGTVFIEKDLINTIYQSNVDIELEYAKDGSGVTMKLIDLEADLADLYEGDENEFDVELAAEAEEGK